MLKRIEGYWMKIIAPEFLFVQRFTLDPLPPGTNVYGSISLSNVNTQFLDNNADPKFTATAFVESWTFYKPDGTESQPLPLRSIDFTQNAIAVENCARITFALVGRQVIAIAQINIFTF